MSNYDLNEGMNEDEGQVWVLKMIEAEQFQKDMARLARVFYLAILEEGFTRAQAWKLLHDWLWVNGKL